MSTCFLCCLSPSFVFHALFAKQVNCPAALLASAMSARRPSSQWYATADLQRRCLCVWLPLGVGMVGESSLIIWFVCWDNPHHTEGNQRGLQQAGHWEPSQVSPPLQTGEQHDICKIAGRALLGGVLTACLARAERRGAQLLEGPASECCHETLQDADCGRGHGDEPILPCNSEARRQGCIAAGWCSGWVCCCLNTAIRRAGTCQCPSSPPKRPSLFRHSWCSPHP